MAETSSSTVNRTSSGNLHCCSCVSATGKHVVSSHGLRLHLPGELVEDGREKATYDLESGGLRADPMDLVCFL